MVKLCKNTLTVERRYGNTHQHQYNNTLGKNSNLINL